MASSARPIAARPGAGHVLPAGTERRVDRLEHGVEARAGAHQPRALRTTMPASRILAFAQREPLPHRGGLYQKCGRDRAASGQRRSGASTACGQYRRSQGARRRTAASAAHRETRARRSRGFCTRSVPAGQATARPRGARWSSRAQSICRLRATVNSHASGCFGTPVSGQVSSAARESVGERIFCYPPHRPNAPRALPAGGRMRSERHPQPRDVSHSSAWSWLAGRRAPRRGTPFEAHRIVRARTASFSLAIAVGAR